MNERHVLGLADLAVRDFTERDARAVLAEIVDYRRARLLVEEQGARLLVLGLPLAGADFMPVDEVLFAPLVPRKDDAPGLVGVGGWLKREG